MAFNVGSGAAIHFGKESEYGTAVAGTHIINFTSEGIKVNAEKADEGNLLASVSPTSRDLMALTVDGNISFILRPEFAGALFKAAFGGTDEVTADSPIAGATKHTIGLVAANGTLPSYTVIVNRKVSVKKYSGVKIDSLQLDAAAGDYVKGQITVKGKDETTGELATLDPLSLQSFRCVGATLKLAGETYDVSSSSFNISNALQDAPQTYASGLYSGEPVQGVREITIDFEIPYSDSIDTLSESYLKTEASLASAELTFKSPSMITGSTPYQITIKMNNIAITDVTSNVGGSGIITSSVSGIALAVGSTAPATVEIIDDTTTAY